MTLYKPAKFELWWADTARSRCLPAAFLFTDSSKTLQVCEGQLPFISKALPVVLSIKAFPAWVMHSIYCHPGQCLVGPGWSPIGVTFALTTSLAPSPPLNMLCTQPTATWRAAPTPNPTPNPTPTPTPLTDCPPCATRAAQPAMQYHSLPNKCRRHDPPSRYLTDMRNGS
jgi:hypothetical protein